MIRAVVGFAATAGSIAATGTATPPLHPARGAAARAAREELSRRIYHQDDPGLVSRALQWLHDALASALAGLSGAFPAGPWAIIILAVAFAAAAVAIRWRLGPLGRSRRGHQDPIFAARARTAAEHRSDADEAAARQAYAEAIRERFRALVRELEERTLLDERPGRTAREVARDVEATGPGLIRALAEAARVFDDVRYGGRTATGELDRIVREADEAAMRAVPEPSVPEPSGRATR